MLEALRIFWTWWRDQLLDLVPGYAERRTAREDDGLILSEPDLSGAPGDRGGSVILTERRHGLAEPASRLALVPDAIEPLRQSAARRRLPVVLQLPGEMLLEREVTLPSAAESSLARVLFHEMDRFTPFAAAEVFWSSQVLSRDRANNRLRVRLSLVPRGPVEALIGGLRQTGLPLSGIELAGVDGERRRIALDADEGDVLVRPGLLPIGLAGLAALLLVAVGLPFLMQSREMAAAERQIAAAAPAYAEVQQLRKDAASGTTGADVIAAQRHKAGDALEALALLTDALPDNTYLTALTFGAGKLTMDGQSQSAAALIAPLTSNSKMTDASFTAPVVRNTLGADTFSMRLRVTP